MTTLFELRRQDLAQVAYDEIAGHAEKAAIQIRHDGSLLLAARPIDRCQGCGQTIPTGNVGHKTWLSDNGVEQGGWSHQHGCGAWNSPVEVTIPPIGDADDMSVRTWVWGGLDRLAEACAAEIARTDHMTEGRLRAELAAFLDRGDDSPTGDEIDPGIMRDGDSWEAWDYAVDGDVIIVTEADLRMRP